MNNSTIKCPQCGYEIPISAALSTQIMSELEAGLRAEREKQIARVVASTSAMYGALPGIVGGRLAAIPALELDGDQEPDALTHG
jgi:hypothetical protein